MDILEKNDQKELYEYILLYDKTIAEIKEIEDCGEEINKELAQELYNVYEAMTNLLKKYKTK